VTAPPPQAWAAALNPLTFHGRRIAQVSELLDFIDSSGPISTPEGFVTTQSVLASLPSLLRESQAFPRNQLVRTERFSEVGAPTHTGTTATGAGLVELKPLVRNWPDSLNPAWGRNETPEPVTAYRRPLSEMWAENSIGETAGAKSNNAGFSTRGTGASEGLLATRGQDRVERVGDAIFLNDERIFAKGDPPMDHVRVVVADDKVIFFADDAEIAKRHEGFKYRGWPAGYVGSELEQRLTARGTLIYDLKTHEWTKGPFTNAGGGTSEVSVTRDRNGRVWIELPDRTTFGLGG
jgi:hypothetical protein